MMTAQELLEGAGITLSDYRPGQHHRTCPRCSAKRSKAHHSLKVLGVKIDADGATWHCNHCGWAGPEKGKDKSNGAGGEFAATYDYPGFQKVRYPKGHEPRFRIRHREGNGWKWGAGDADTSVLYRKDEVDKAIALGHIIVSVEGEKDADALWAIGIAATCNMQGANQPGRKPKWTTAHSEQLRGADLVVLGDHDPAGYAHQDATCRLSLGVAKRVRILKLAEHWPDCPEGGDISDWLAAGHTREQLDELFEQALDYKTESEPRADKADAEIERLAKLTPLEYEQQRKGAAEKIDVRASILDSLVGAARARLNPDADGKQGHAVAFPEPEPWPEPVNGATLLDATATAIRNHVVMSDAARDACALWVLHTYLTDRFLVSPRLGVRSPTKGCGKTLLLDVLGRLVLRPLPAANVTSAAIFRVIEAHRPTLLVDEADTFLYENDELRGILNSGHRKGGSVLRTVGDDHEPRSFATYPPCVIALIGVLPDTLHDRAVTVDLKRRLRSENVEPFRPDRADHLDELARKAARWANDTAERIGGMDPAMPAGIVNRAADNWRPLLAIADAAGGEWPQRAREAAVDARAATEDDDGSRLEPLLSDIRDLFGTKAEMPSADLVGGLVALEGRPWAEMGKARKPLTQNMLARMLKPLKIAPDEIGPEDARVRGYKRARFKEAFGRYLPEEAPEGASQPSSRPERDEMGTSDIFKPSSPPDGWTDVKCEKSNNDGLLDGWTVAKGGSGEKTQVRTARPKSDDHEIASPDDILDIPRFLDLRRCAHCNRNGALGQVALPDRPGTIWLHRECEGAWLEATTHKQSSR